MKITSPPIITKVMTILGDRLIQPVKTNTVNKVTVNIIERIGVTTKARAIDIINNKRPKIV